MRIFINWLAQIGRAINWKHYAIIALAISTAIFAWLYFNRSVTRADVELQRQKVEMERARGNNLANDLQIAHQDADKAFQGAKEWEAKATVAVTAAEVLKATVEYLRSQVDTLRKYRTEHVRVGSSFAHAGADTTSTAPFVAQATVPLSMTGITTDSTAFPITARALIRYSIAGFDITVPPFAFDYPAVVEYITDKPWLKWIMAAIGFVVGVGLTIWAVDRLN